MALSDIISCYYYLFYNEDLIKCTQTHACTDDDDSDISTPKANTRKVTDKHMLAHIHMHS